VGEPITRNVLLHFEHHGENGRPYALLVRLIAGQAVHRVAHDQRRLSGIQDDDGLTALGAPDLLDPAGRCACDSSMFLRVPGPALRDATVATISAYSTGWTEETAATIGMVAWLHS